MYIKKYKKEGFEILDFPCNQFGGQAKEPIDEILKIREENYGVKFKLFDKIKVNGKEAELIDNDLHFLLVALEEGENVVEFTYSSPYVKYAALGLAGAFVGLLAVAFVVKKTRWMEKCATVVAWAGVSLALAVTLIFMVLPVLVFVGKLGMAAWTKLSALF